VATFHELVRQEIFPGAVLLVVLLLLLLLLLLLRPENPGTVRRSKPPS
jgi:hypothetical protein